MEPANGSELEKETSKKDFILLNSLNKDFEKLEVNQPSKPSLTKEINIRTSIKSMKSLVNKAISCCKVYISNDKYIKLSQSEEKLLSKTEKAFQEQYNSKNKDHEKLIETLIDPRRRLTYEDLGLESTNPRDFFQRTGGFICLKYMNHFLSFYPHEYMDMKLNKLDFSFAVICMKLTISLMKFLGFTYIEDSSDDIQITNKELKRFVLLLEDNENVFLDVLSKSFVFFKVNFKIFVLDEKAKGDLSKDSITQLIDVLVRETIKILKECLNMKSIKTKFHLIEFYDGRINKMRLCSVYKKS